MGKPRKSLAWALFAFACAIMLGGSFAWADPGAFGETSGGIQRDTADNVVATGGAVTVSQDAPRDVMAFGNAVTIEKIPVGGDVIAAGQMVEIGKAEVAGDVRAAGSQVTLSGTQASGNVTIAGSSLGFGEGAQAQAVYAAGAQVSYQGSAHYAALTGSRVYFDGTVDGDVVIDANKVTVGENANITGKLTVVGVQPDIAEGAQVGSVDVQLASQGMTGNVLLDALAGALVMLLTMALTIAVIFWLAPSRPQDSLFMLQARTMPMIVTGIVALLAVPLLVLALAVTGIGAYLAIAFMCVAIALAVLGLPFMAAAVARRLMKNAPLWAVVLAAAAVAGIVSIIPGISTIAMLCGGIYIAGYVLQLLYLKLNARSMRAKAQPRIS